MFWLSAVAIASAIQLNAQEPRRLTQPDSISAELAGALMAAGGFAGEPQILPGALPGWVEAKVYVPAGAQILGSAFLGTTTVGVLAVSQEPDAAIAALKPELEKRGWAPPPPPPSYGGGFRNPPTAMMGNVPVITALTLCGGDQQMLMVRASRQRGATRVLYRIAPGAMYSICHPPQPPPGAIRSPYPTLFNPPAAGDYTATQRCQQNGGWGTNTQLRTPMSLEEILEHYAKQMADSGWHPAANAIGRVWTKVDSAGTPQQASLIVSPSTRDSLCRDVSLQVSPVKRP